MVDNNNDNNNNSDSNKNNNNYNNNNKWVKIKMPQIAAARQSVSPLMNKP